MGLGERWPTQQPRLVRAGSGRVEKRAEGREGGGEESERGGVGRLWVGGRPTGRRRPTNNGPADINTVMARRRAMLTCRRSWLGAGVGSDRLWPSCRDQGQPLSDAAVGSRVVGPIQGSWPAAVITSGPELLTTGATASHRVTTESPQRHRSPMWSHWAFQ